MTADDETLEEHIRHIKEASRDPITFVEGMDRETFLADLRTQRAVTMSLMIVGEAASRIIAEHPAYIAGRSDVPWRSIRGMRNRIAHGYYDINLAVVWDTVAEDLPQLLALVEADGT